MGPAAAPRRDGAPLKVFHVLSNPTVGGVEQFLARLLPLFDPARFDVRLVNMRDDSACYELWEASGARCLRQRTPGRLLLGSVPPLSRLLRAEGADIVELYGLRANVIGRLAARAASVPVVLSEVTSTDDWRRWYHVRLDRLTSWAVTEWIANSEASKRSLEERERHPESRVSVIYDGIDLDYWRPGAEPQARQRVRRELGAGAAQPLVATVANLRPSKGYQHLLAALPLIAARRPDCRFVAVGADMMEGRVQRLAAELGVSDRILFAGPRRDVRALYAAADVALLPSVYEGLGLSLAEAMAVELPVVATRVGGIPEVVEDGVTGLLVPPADPAALADAVLRLAGDEGLRRRLGRAGRERVARRFCIRRAVEQRQSYYLQRYLAAASR